MENEDGSIHRIVNIGVPPDHPLAAPIPNGPAGLHNMRLGAMPLPVAPTFIIRMRRPRDRGTGSDDGPDVTAGPAIAGSGPRVTIAPHREVTDEELQQIDRHIDRITVALNIMIGRFQEIFLGQQLARMQRAFGVSGPIMGNVGDPNLSPDEQLLEMVRRMSLEEYER